MHSLAKTNIGIRAQAGGVMLVTAVWYLSIWHALFDYGGGYFWGIAFLGSLILDPVLALILLVSYFDAGRRHGRWVWCALLAFIIPWALYICFLLLVTVGGY
jgi:hypothetical protein